MKRKLQNAIGLTQIVRVARPSGAVSSPMLARTLNLELAKAEVVLADLADAGYLELMPESGLVKTYRITRTAYDEIETDRSRCSVLNGFWNSIMARLSFALL